MKKWHENLQDELVYAPKKMLHRTMQNRPTSTSQISLVKDIIECEVTYAKHRKNIRPAGHTMQQLRGLYQVIPGVSCRFQQLQHPLIFAQVHRCIPASTSLLAQNSKAINRITQQNRIHLGLVLFISRNDGEKNLLTRPRKNII